MASEERRNKKLEEGSKEKTPEKSLRIIDPAVGLQGFQARRNRI